MRALLAPLTTGALLLGACGSDDDAGQAADVVTVTDPWVRRPVDGQTTAAMYGVVTNSGGDAVTAVAATASVTDDVELHEVVMNDDGTMTMQEKDGGYTIEAGGSITLEPGGLHVMMLAVDPADFPDEVDVTIEFDDGSEVALNAEVRNTTGSGMDMDHGEMEMDDG